MLRIPKRVPNGYQELQPSSRSRIDSHGRIRRSIRGSRRRRARDQRNDFSAAAGPGRAGRRPSTASGRPSGFVFRLEKARGPSWWAKYRLPDGTQVKRKIGPGLDRARAAADRLLHQAPRRGLAARPARRGPAGRRAGITAAAAVPSRPSGRDRRADRRDLRRRRGRVPALRRAGSRLQALDDPRLPQRDQGPPAAGVRRDGARGHHRAGDRALARRHVERPPARASSRTRRKNNLLVLMHAIFRRAVKLYGLPAQPGRERRPLPRPEQRRHPGVLARGGLGAGPCRRLRGRRGDLPDRCVHRACGAASCSALRWRDVDFAGSTIRVRASYAAGQADDAEVRQGALGADGPRRRERARAARPTRAIHRRRRLRVRRRGGATARRRRAQQPLRRRARSAPVCAACASTTCATRSVRG